MTKLIKIKYLFNNQYAASLSKYFALAGLLYSSLSPLSTGALGAAELNQYDKPALLAMARTQFPIPMNPGADKEDISNFTVFFGSTIAGRTNPAAPAQNIKAAEFSVSPSIIIDDGAYGVKEIMRDIIVTAYSSTPDQTDDSPFITAMGSRVHDGIVAANFLRFGTKVRIPEIYGGKIFVVEDRMAKRNSHKVDIWMESRAAALQFGVKRLTLEILE